MQCGLGLGVDDGKWRVDASFVQGSLEESQHRKCMEAALFEFGNDFKYGPVNVLCESKGGLELQFIE